MPIRLYGWNATKPSTGILKISAPSGHVREPPPGVGHGTFSGVVRIHGQDEAALRVERYPMGSDQEKFPCRENSLAQAR
jgi:hypothetical protein